MKISVITPAYNCEKFINESINSILSQTYANWELIIGDDGSSDSTKNIIDTYAYDDRIKIYHASDNMGCLKMYNYLFSKATGDYIMMHDADDVSLPSRMQEQINIIVEYGVDACGTNGVLFSDNGENIGNNIDEKSFLLDAINTNNYRYLPFFPASLLLKKQIYEDIGGFNIFFDRLSSMDRYWIFLMQKKYKVYFYNKILYRARVHSGSNHRSINVDDIYKLASFDIFYYLVKQRLLTGSDDLEKGDLENINKFVSDLNSNKTWKSEKLREYAAIRTDVGDIGSALKLIYEAIKINVFGLENYRTLLYTLRKKVGI